MFFFLIPLALSIVFLIVGISTGISAMFFMAAVYLAVCLLFAAGAYYSSAMHSRRAKKTRETLLWNINRNQSNGGF